MLFNTENVEWKVRARRSHFPFIVAISNPTPAMMFSAVDDGKPYFNMNIVYSTLP